MTKRKLKPRTTLLTIEIVMEPNEILTCTPTGIPPAKLNSGEMARIAILLRDLVHRIENEICARGGDLMVRK
jgi:hypothetical protein